MSTKILLPLSAIAACPLTLIAAYSEKSTPDEASVDHAGVVSQQTNAKATIDAARLSKTMRPDRPQPSIERSPQSIHLRTPTSDMKVSSNLVLAPPPPAPMAAHVSAVRKTNVSLEEVVARSIAPVRIPSASSNVSLNAKRPVSVQPAAIAAVPAGSLAQMPVAAIAPEAIATTPTPALRAVMPSAVSSVSPTANPRIPEVPPDALLDSFTSSVSTGSVSTSTRETVSTSTRETALAPSSPQSQDLPLYSSTVLSDVAPTDSFLNTKSRLVDVSALQTKATHEAILDRGSASTIAVFPPQPIVIADASLQALPAVAIAPENSIPVTSEAIAPVAEVRAAQPIVQPTVAQPVSQPTAVSQPIAVSQPTAVSQPEIIGATYTLGAGDQINVNFFNVPEYSGAYQVADDGSVNLPVIGGVSLVGLTLQEASGFIANLYQNELAHPRVTVNLVRRHPSRVSIIGEVGKPGLYTLGTDQGNQVIQAIQSAGGFTQSANLRQVQIRRSFRGLNQTIAVNVWNLLENGDLTQNLTLQDGDSLYIPATNGVDLVESGRLASSTLASTTNAQVKVGLVGEVNHPGAYQIASTAGARATLTQAIQSAGGITPTADIRRVQIHRTTRMGSSQAIDIDLSQLLQSGDLNQDLILQDGDTIVLAKAEQLSPAESIQLASTNLSPSAIQVNLMGEVKSPGSVQLPSSITLNQALLQAGGLNGRARRSAQLVRMNSNGTLTRRTIDLNFNQDANLESNPVLQNNDVVIVGRSTLTQIEDGVSNVLSPILRIFSPVRGLLGL